MISSFNKTAFKKTDINPNVVQILKTCLEYKRYRKTRKDRQEVVLQFRVFISGQSISKAFQGVKNQNSV